MKAGLAVGFKLRLADVAAVSRAGRPRDRVAEPERNIDLMPPSIQATPIHLDSSPRLIGFPFHSTCWCILFKRLSWGDRELQLLFDLCLSFRNEEIMFDWDHNYGGTVSYDDDCRVLGPGEEPHLSSWADNDPNDGEEYPLHLHELDRIFEQRTNDSIPTANCPTRLQRYARPTHADAFQMLTVEILQSILVRLPAPDVAAVRMVSPAVANVHLHDKFWRTRFLSGREFDFIFETQRHPHDSSFKGRWKSTYFSVRELRHLPVVAGSASCDGSSVPFSIEDNGDSSSVDMDWETASSEEVLCAR
ncbi:hypothetical protein N657DRAFT_635195 [Parathielavia appendiculata]|uniref:F-box domain-containing protein n=1 Tax=Parathielavia appendiculata TaxID=2587402 RepID=A0AAN6Z1T8_9PEZI|nr:hypothetical protein N657DRAFT_635195 [Parathielavia appendiculata]